MEDFFLVRDEEGSVAAASALLLLLLPVTASLPSPRSLPLTLGQEVFLDLRLGSANVRLVGYSVHHSNK